MEPSGGVLVHDEEVAGGWRDCADGLRRTIRGPFCSIRTQRIVGWICLRLGHVTNMNGDIISNNLPVARVQVHIYSRTGNQKGVTRFQVPGTR